MENSYESVKKTVVMLLGRNLNNLKQFFCPFRGFPGFSLTDITYISACHFFFNMLMVLFLLLKEHLCLILLELLPIKS